jgi:hypothetical protein
MLPMNPPLHPSQEGNLQPVLEMKLPSSEGPGVSLWLRCASKRTWSLPMNQVKLRSRAVRFFQSKAAQQRRPTNRTFLFLKPT